MDNDLPAPNPPATNNVEAYLAMLAGVKGLPMPATINNNVEYYLRQLVEYGVAGLYGGKNLEDQYTIEELSTKVQSGDFSGINIGDYITKTVKVGSNTARELDFVVAGIDYWYGIGDTELTTHHLLMVPKEAFYETMKINDIGTTVGGYYGSQAHGIASAAYTAGAGGALTNAVVDYTTFLESTIEPTDGTYTFVRNSSSKWELDGVDVGANLSAYGVTYSGTPVKGDTIAVTFEKGYLEPYRQAIYDAFGDSHIIKHHSYQTTSASAAQWHSSRVELMNECMIYGSKMWASSSYSEMCSPMQLPYFAMYPNARIAHRGKGGPRNNVWLSSINGGSSFCCVGNDGHAAYYAASNALAVRPYFLFA